MFYILNYFRNILPWKIVTLKKDVQCHWCDGRHVKGVNNQIIIGNQSILYNCTFLIKGNNNKIIIGENCKFNKVSFWISGDNNTIIIGANTTVGKRCEFATLEGTSITIGNDCMFSHDIRLRTSDSHSIINCDGVRINYAKSIRVGNHCWIGMQVLMLKGSRVLDNSIIAARALVSKQFDEGCAIIAGMPAKIIKTNVNWDRKRL